MKATFKTYQIDDLDQFYLIKVSLSLNSVSNKKDGHKWEEVFSGQEFEKGSLYSLQNSD